MRKKIGLFILLILSLTLASNSLAGHGCSVSGVSDDTKLNSEGTDGAVAYQNWGASFQSDRSRGYRSGCSSISASTMHVSDDDGNSADISNPGYDYRLETDQFSWLQGGDDVSVYFSRGGYTTSEVTDRMPFTITFQNPDPAKSNTGSPVDSTSPNLNINVTEHNGNDITVSFYDASNGDLIGSDTVSGGSGIATVEWSGLTDGGTYTWYAEACGASCKQTASNYEFDVNGIPSIEEINFYDSNNAHEFEAVARITDADDYTDLASCNVQATNQDGDSKDYGSIAFDSGSGNEAYCRVNVHYNDVADWEHLDTLDVNFTVSDSKNTVQRQATHTLPNNDPRIGLTESNFNDYDHKHAFNISADIVFSDNEDQEPNSSESCRIILKGENTGGKNVYNSSIDSELNPEFEYLGEDQAKCSYSRVEPASCETDNCNGGFDFDVLEDINVTVKAYDAHGAVGSESFTKQIPNKKPVIHSASPKDGEVILEKDVILETRVTEAEGEKIDLKFSDADTGDEIELLENENEGRHQASWSSIGGEGTYRWRLNVSDAYSSTVQEFSFSKIISPSYRIETNIEHEYSSLIVNKGGSRSLIFESSIKSSPRDFITYLEGNGIETEFTESGNSFKNYEVSANNPVRNQITITGEEVGETELKIVSEDQELNINTTENFPVYVRPSNDEGSGVPGLPGIYLLFILLAGSYLYFESL